MPDIDQARKILHERLWHHNPRYDREVVEVVRANRAGGMTWEGLLATGMIDDVLCKYHNL